MADDGCDSLPLYRPTPGDRIRILIIYQAGIRPILWFKIARDGSLYVGPRYEQVNELRHGISDKMDTNQFQVSYLKGEEIDDPEMRNSAKLSIHSSGIINTPGGRFSRESLRGITDQTLLCLVAFQHPKFFPSIDQAEIGKRDVCLHHVIDESRPLWAHMYIAPVEKTKLVRPPSTVSQVNLMFEYRDLTNFPDIIAQLVIGHGVQGEWPRLTGVAYPFLDTGNTGTAGTVSAQ